MPYISQEERKALRHRAPATPGELNYSISLLCDDFMLLNRGGVSYEGLNEIIGVLACVQQELYRRVAAPYEDQKMRTNGEVFNAADEVEAMVQRENEGHDYVAEMRDEGKAFSLPEQGPITVKHEGLFQQQYDNFALDPNHEAYHIEYEPDSEGNKVAVLVGNNRCPFCRDTIGARLDFRDAAAKETEHGQTKPRRSY